MVSMHSVTELYIPNQNEYVGPASYFAKTQEGEVQICGVNKIPRSVILEMVNLGFSFLLFGFSRLSFSDCPGTL